jgi:hypothetical protein
MNTLKYNTLLEKNKPKMAGSPKYQHHNASRNSFSTGSKRDKKVNGNHPEVNGKIIVFE